MGEVTELPLKKLLEQIEERMSLGVENRRDRPSIATLPRRIHALEPAMHEVHGIVVEQVHYGRKGRFWRFDWTRAAGVER